MASSCINDIGMLTCSGTQAMRISVILYKKQVYPPYVLNIVHLGEVSSFLLTMVRCSSIFHVAMRLKMQDLYVLLLRTLKKLHIISN
jgi:aminoglycoside phosphotransferase